MALPPAEDASRAVSAPVAMATCAAMAVLYVAILYAPTLLLRLPSPASLDSFLIRRFVCALVSSIVSVVAVSTLLGIRSFEETSHIFSVFGIRRDHMLQAVLFPVLLTSLLYAGSFVSKSLSTPSALASYGGSLLSRMQMLSTNVLVWRNYVVAPITEELVFRACMIPLLLCGGFKLSGVIFFCPVFFSLAHLNHFMELYYLKGYTFLKASQIVVFQLGYTVIFGWYAAFLFIRTGNLLCPIVAHVFCNLMGLPALYSSQSKVATGMAALAGLFGFFYLLFPATSPKLYNDKIDNCRCWHGYCNWD